MWIVKYRQHSAVQYVHSTSPGLSLLRWLLAVGMEIPVRCRHIGPARGSVRIREESIVTASEASRYSRLPAENGNPKRERGSRRLASDSAQAFPSESGARMCTRRLPPRSRSHASGYDK